MTLVPSVHPKFQLTSFGHPPAVTVMFEATVDIGDGGSGGDGGARGGQGGRGKGGSPGGKGGDDIRTASISSQPFTCVWTLTCFTSMSPERSTLRAEPHAVVSAPDHAVLATPVGSISSTLVTNGAFSVS